MLATNIKGGAGCGNALGLLNMPSLPAVQIANTFIERYARDGNIDHLKLQKLSYFAYGWWLAICAGRPPLANVRPQVWKLGPVFLPIYGAFASFRDGNIHHPQKIGPFQSALSIPDDDGNESEVVNWIWARYGHFRGVELSNMTHEPGTPWYNIAKSKNFVVPKYFEMSDDENRPYFTELARKEGLI